ncbi:oligoendopeptidase F [Herpetosiphon llansteffanensis]|uniref:oligoendopeptidase F n=1 Tax=Herpetosiphon llansteffanensis TaxID=2094568 RepID=UPI000D7C99FE|nr:oligoendopeptidase F [Herpetosiphon llansteffanensis]
MTTAATVPTRQEVALADTWDATKVFASDAEWEQALDAYAQSIAEIEQYQGRLAEGAPTLLAALNYADQLNERIGKLYIYASLFYSVDTTDQVAKAKMDRVLGVYARTMASSAFIEPEIIGIGFETLKQWQAENADLAGYGQYFNEVERRQAHVRSAEVEQVLGLVSDAFDSANSTHRILTDADLAYPAAHGPDASELELTQGTIGLLLTDPDREVRRTAFENYSDAHLANKNTMANCMATCVKQHVFNARVRNYSSALAAALGENNIPTDVFHQLVATVRKNYPTWHRYWRLRREALGYDQLHVYDIKAPLSTKKLDIPYTEAVDWIIAGMQPLGEGYTSAAKRGLLDDRWVDIYPNKGKSAGAFSSGWKGTPPYILMNYNNDIFGMSTLAHELGHSMHSYLTWQNQPTIYSNYGLFVAEVASNFNQALVRNHLFNTNQDPDFQIALIEEAMSNFHRYFFIMPILAQFELEIHERGQRGEPLTAATLNGIMFDLFREGYGEEVVPDADRMGITWATFSGHMYANFYVYQYATGIAAAHALAEGVLAGKPDAQSNYLAFLSAGSSLAPLDALKLAGVDMTSAEPVEAAFRVLASYVDRLEQLLANK